MKNCIVFLIVLSVFNFSSYAQNIPLAEKGVSLLPANASLFVIDASFAQWVDVENQTFKKAYHISTLNKSDKDNYAFYYRVDSTIHNGDVLLLSFYTRSIESKKETGESFFEVSLDRIVEGKYNWPPLLERGISFGKSWTLTQIPFIASKDVKSGELSFVVKCGKFPQIFQMADISLMKYNSSVNIDELPRSIVRYDGDAPNASWRKEAADRIEKYRKGDLTIKVVDKKGKPIKDAVVKIQMTRNAFAWGTATNSNTILDTNNPTAKIYRDTLLRYFNKVVFENEMKSRNWAKTDHQKTIDAAAWFKQHDIPVRGHVMVWPSWKHSPHLVPLKNDTFALRETIVTIIADQTRVMKGQFDEWDVINEPYAHHDIIDLLGKNVMVDWFKYAHEKLPDVQLFLNDYTMFHAKDAGSESFYNTIKFLIDSDAPIDAIGEQAHIGGTPPAMDYVIERLDHFAEFGLPIQISEFDITSDDDDFKARYMRDFMTAIYSHPSTIGFVQWGFWAGAHWIPAGALWDMDWNRRPHGKVYAELVTEVWATHTTGSTSKDGLFTIRAFTGEYVITVQHAGEMVNQKYSLDNRGGMLSIVYK